MRYFKFTALLQQKNWVSPAFVGVDNNGIIQYLSDKEPLENSSIEKVSGYALPGFQNAHSHAFQYAMAGKVEKNPSTNVDDFWSWRESMYRYALSVDPDQLEAIATMLYAEMLSKGYTQVAEFHYLHHDRNGAPFNNLAEMGTRLIAAAKIAGIRITLVPVFYQKSNFGKDPLPQQRRFICQNIDDYFQLLDDSSHAVIAQGYGQLGFGVHSLRAVDHVDIIQTYNQGPIGIPFHIHVAEQKKEVQDCIEFLKIRPVEWMLDNLPVNNRFNLVHCTHLTNNEISKLASSGGNVVLCPGTEGNLGDGIFRLADFVNNNGNFCIGTDSQISLNLMEDLRWLDYAQRLTTHKRNTMPDGGRMLFHHAIINGRGANGIFTSEFFEIGQPFDAVIYNGESPLLGQSELDNLLSTILYTCDSSQIYGTIVNGEWIVKGRHRDQEQILLKFLTTMQSLSRVS